MLVTVLLFAAAGQIGEPGYGYPGRLSTLRAALRGEPCWTANGVYTLDVERVLKVHAIVGRRVGDTYGARVYGGSLSLRAPSGAWGFELPDADRAVSVQWPDQWSAAVIQTLSEGTWKAQVSADLVVDVPVIWFTLRRVAGAAPIQAAFLGYGWAQRTAPREWVIGGQAYQRPDGREIDVPVDTAGSLTAIFRDPEGFSGALRFSPAPADLRLSDDGFTWSYAPAVSEAQVCYGFDVDGHANEALISEHVRRAEAWIGQVPAAPPLMVQTFGCDGGPRGQPWMEISCKKGGPVLLAGVVSESPLRMSLDQPPLIDQVAPDFRPLSDDARRRVDDWVRQALSHQKPDGSFTFGLGRGFYDGITCGVLALVLNLVSTDIRPALHKAIEAGLRHLWFDTAECRDWPGVLLPPEVPDFHASATDYPEIEACILQATALYAAQTGGEIARELWPQIHRQFEQLRFFYDLNGIALASPGPGYHHVIAESAIGGYLAWHGLYHLALMADQPSYAAEARARAALAWRAWQDLFRWRDDYGDPPAVVNGINQGIVECLTQPPWAYVQSTWFTFLPGFALPRDDTFGVWRMLRAQPWWEWTGALGSTQRAYDACNAIALWRAGYREEVLAHWAEVCRRPFSWNTFDETPIHAIAAEAWLSGVE
ncbi:MAG: hypothetical protein N2512_10735 [Armatimonadetes bacterium]|nr:hypothetical protein [Armatimonadota bacterium]